MDEITILIIEDDEDIRESVKILLENEGFHVIEADNGMDGLHQISEDTDLVILDIMMPGISGIKTCEQIRKISYVPILFLTAKSSENDKIIGFTAGADDYLVKPFSYADLSFSYQFRAAATDGKVGIHSFCNGGLLFGIVQCIADKWLYGYTGMETVGGSKDKCLL